MSLVHKGMGKILNGVMRYQRSIAGELVPFFREILDKPSPKTIMVTCIDSRIVVSRLVQAEPGAYFLVRSLGNFIPKYESLETSVPSGTPATLELACVITKANTVVVVGHSDSKPMNMLYDMRDKIEETSAHERSELKKWLVLNGADTVKKFRTYEKQGPEKPLVFSEDHANKFEAYIDPDNRFNIRDKFSMINTLEQLKNVNNYNFLSDLISNHSLRGYAMWVDIATSDLYMFSYKEKRFVKIDETTYERLYAEANP